MTSEDFYNKDKYSTKIGNDFSYTVPIDTLRINTRIYEYICNLEECNQFFYDNLPQRKKLSLEEFEDELSRGSIILQILSQVSPIKKIYINETKSYKHMENIMTAINTLSNILPKNFLFEPIDLYDKKNIPKVIYAIHALAQIHASKFEHKMKELFGKISFDKHEITRIEKQIKENNISLNNQKESSINIKKETYDNIIRTFIKNIIIKNKLNNNKINNKALNEDINQLNTEDNNKLNNELNNENNELNNDKLKNKNKIIVQFIKLRTYQLALKDIFKKRESSIHTIRKILPLFIRESIYIKKEKNMHDSELKLKELRMTKINLEEEVHHLRNKIIVSCHNRNKCLDRIIDSSDDNKKIREIVNLYLKEFSINDLLNLKDDEEKIVLKKDEVNKIINYYHSNNKYLDIKKVKEEIFIPLDIGYCTKTLKHKVLVLLLVSRGKSITSMLMNCDEKEYQINKKLFSIEDSFSEFIKSITSEFYKFYKELKRSNKVTFNYDIDLTAKYLFDLLLEDLLFLKFNKTERENENITLKHKSEEIQSEINYLQRKKESYTQFFNDYLNYVFKKSNKREEEYESYKVMINDNQYIMNCLDKDTISLKKEGIEYNYCFSDMLVDLYKGDQYFTFGDTQICLKEFVEIVNMSYVY